MLTQIGIHAGAVIVDITVRVAACMGAGVSRDISVVAARIGVDTTDLTQKVEIIRSSALLQRHGVDDLLSAHIVSVKVSGDHGFHIGVA